MPSVSNWIGTPRRRQLPVVLGSVASAAGASAACSRLPTLPRELLPLPGCCFATAEVTSASTLLWCRSRMLPQCRSRCSKPHASSATASASTTCGTDVARAHVAAARARLPREHEQVRCRACSSMLRASAKHENSQPSRSRPPSAHTNTQYSWSACCVRRGADRVARAQNSKSLRERGSIRGVMKRAHR